MLDGGRARMHWHYRCVCSGAKRTSPERAGTNGPTQRPCWRNKSHLLGAVQVRGSGGFQKLVKELSDDGEADWKPSWSSRPRT